MIRLFKIQSGDVLFASTQTPVESLNRELQIRFKKSISLTSQGLYHLGASCALRSRETESESRNYFSSGLLKSYSRKIEAGTELVVQKISFRPGLLRAELSETKNGQSSLEMICANPTLVQWTVTSFEIHNRGVLELRSNIQRDPATESRAYDLPGNRLETLDGNGYNGFFGSGLPGTSGVQLLIGSNPQAFARNGNRALWVGNRCAVLGEETSSNTAQYTKDSKFAYLGRTVDVVHGKVRFEFRNWGYSLESLTVECNGTASEVLAMNTAQVESDLNHSIHFYRK